ncbi:MAG TPA: LD-carboxypeptidase [Vicinamibacterales bacterium]|nr:LD-carboxypeptidase [Vicinamibacterales bacterium]
MRKPRALRKGDRIAVVAPASPFARDAFEAGLIELRTLGFEPVFDESVFDRRSYLAGTAVSRAAAFQKAWTDSSVAAIIAARGGYGSVHLLPLLDPDIFSGTPKAFIGYSDNTSLLTWLNQSCGVVSFHGPMIEGRFALGESAYDRDTFTRCLCRAEPAGEITHPLVEVIKGGEAAGMLVGGTLAMLAASLGTPYAFAPPAGSVLFLEDVSERPYRLDRMLTQLRLAGVLDRAAALVFGTMPSCDEPGGATTGREAVVDLVSDFQGPVLYGFPSGHTDGATLTLPFGVRARVVAGSRPALIIEEAAVTGAGD